MKNIIILAVVLLPLPDLAALEQKSPPVRSADAPLLVWDLDPAITNGFRNFRTTNDPLKPKADGSLPSAAGLATLHESGSSEFSPEGLKAMLGKFSGPITVFDLRQEDHGFINGTPISWFASSNWANVGKDHATVVTEEHDRMAGMKPGAAIAISDDKAKKGEASASVAKAEVISAAATEQQVVNAAGASYVRITVSDHCRPTDEEVDRFVTAVRQLPAGAWVHFHCRAGRGRTTTFMALYDMLRNARQVSLLDIDQRQSLLAGDYDLLGKEGEPGARAAVAADRAAFVRAFYDYAKANPNGQPQLWTDWLKSQP
jgi:protein-tyrosine phosphatase